MSATEGVLYRYWRSIYTIPLRLPNLNPNYQIIYRQKYEHLTIVDDELFMMILKFDRQIYPHLTSQDVSVHEDNFFSHILQNVLDSVFIDSNINIPDEITPDAVYPPFAKYLRVCMKELGTRIVQSHKVKKKMAHRKQVLLEEAKLAAPSQRLKVTHGTSTPVPILPPYSQPTEPAAATCASAGDVCVETSIIKSNTQESASDDYYCTVCSGRYVKNRMCWIECSTCNGWCHRKCDPTIKAQRAWLRALKSDFIYTCPHVKPGDESLVFAWDIWVKMFQCLTKIFLACSWTMVYLSDESMVCSVQLCSYPPKGKTA